MKNMECQRVESRDVTYKMRITHVSRLNLSSCGSFCRRVIHVSGPELSWWRTGMFFMNHILMHTSLFCI